MAQILSDFIMQGDAGLYCSYGGFYLDPQTPVGHAVISHAHGDHAVSGNQNVYCTAPTKAFMLSRYKKFAAAEFMVSAFNQPFELNGVKITLLPAGHMLGSAMVLMEFKGRRYLYTGDYKLADDATCEPIKLVNADVLITETTFAKSTHIHPGAAEEIKKLNHVEANIMLGAYALGKSQRLIWLINQYCPDKTILVHHSTMPFVRLYEDLGVKLGNYQFYDRKLMKNSTGGMVYLVPPMVYNSYFRASNVVRIFASGWDNLQSQNQVKLFISDHVDWPAILETIAQVNPQEVWTIHGDGRELQAHFENQIVVKLLNR